MHDERSWHQPRAHTTLENPHLPKRYQGSAGPHTGTSIDCTACLFTSATSPHLPARARPRAHTHAHTHTHTLLHTQTHTYTHIPTPVRAHWTAAGRGSWALRRVGGHVADREEYVNNRAARRVSKTLNAQCPPVKPASTTRGRPPPLSACSIKVADQVGRTRRRGPRAKPAWTRASSSLPQRRGCAKHRGAPSPRPSSGHESSHNVPGVRCSRGRHP